MDGDIDQARTAVIAGEVQKPDATEADTGVVGVQRQDATRIIPNRHSGGNGVARDVRQRIEQRPKRSLSLDQVDLGLLTANGRPLADGLHRAPGLGSRGPPRTIGHPVPWCSGFVQVRGGSPHLQPAARAIRRSGAWGSSGR